jgi:hypothetical protein
MHLSSGPETSPCNKGYVTGTHTPKLTIPLYYVVFTVYRTQLCDYGTVYATENVREYYNITSAQVPRSLKA